MARQKGIIKLKGTIGDITFYKTQDGELAREKGGVDASRIANDPAFVRTRENGAEFGAAAGSGKLVKDTLRPMMMSARDNRVTSRLTKLMTEIKKLDSISVRGQRNVGVAIANPAARALLKGFNFNIRSILGALLFKPFNVTLATGEITIANFIPLNDIAYPSGATHVSLKSAFARIDFASGVAEVHESNVVNLPIDVTPSAIMLTPAAVPAGVGTDLYLLQIEFFQEVNGAQYPLKNGAHNALAIVEVN